MLNGSLADKILLYALPLAATGILQQLFNAADIAVVGQFAGKEAMAAVGSNSPLIGLLINLFVGISLGTNVVIATAIGQKKTDIVNKAVHTSILVAIAGGIFLTVIGEILAAPVITLLGVPDDVYSMALLYLRVYLCGMPVILLYNFEASIFRSIGNTRMPLLALIAGGVINVTLNLFFVVILHMTVNGVALATVISNFVSSLILFIKLRHTDAVIRVRKEEFGIDRQTLKRILHIGVPSGLQGMVFSLANIIIQSAINSLGTVVMAASSAAFNLEVFAYYVLNSFGQACTTFVGQNHGAGKEKRCNRTLWICLCLDALFSAVTCSLILLFAHTLLGVFNSDAEVIQYGTVRLQYIFLGYVFSLFQEVISGYMRGYGVSLIPAVCTIAGICGTRVIWIYTVFRANPTFTVIMQVYPVSLAITALIIAVSALIFKKKNPQIDIESA